MTENNDTISEGTLATIVLSVLLCILGILAYLAPKLDLHNPTSAQCEALAAGMESIGDCR